MSAPQILEKGAPASNPTISLLSRPAAAAAL